MANEAAAVYRTMAWDALLRLNKACIVYLRDGSGHINERTYIPFVFGGLYQLSKFLCDDITWRRTQKIWIGNKKFGQAVCVNEI